MKFKKLMLRFLCVVMLLSTTVVFADDTTQKIEITQPDTVEMKNFSFGSFVATVKEINDYTPEEGAKFVSLEDKEGMPINMIVSKDTYIVGSKGLTVGDSVTGYYRANAPMILIYPPQYNVEVVVVEQEDQNVKVDLFNEDLVSSDNMLKLNIADSTQIIIRDGKEYKGELANKKLVAIYDISTKSIPAQTTPIKVVVLSEANEVEGAEEVVTEISVQDVSEMDIIVNNIKLNAPKAYSNNKVITMVPLRAIVNGLNIDVVWESKEDKITVGEGVSLKIGSNDYISMNSEPITLEVAPELKEGITYVPLNFFKKVMGMNNAYVFEGQIVIDNAEEMH